MNKKMFLSLLASTFLNTAAMAADDVYTIKEGTESDYDFTMQEPDGNGGWITRYYKIDLNPSTFTASTNIVWQEVGEYPKDEKDTNLSDGTVSGVVSPYWFGKNKYYKYTYTKPEGYAVTNERIDDTLNSSNVTNVVFSGISGIDNGVVIYNTQDNSSVNINADFVGNYAQSSSEIALRGMVYNGNSAAIGDISGNFIGNYIQLAEWAEAYGSVIYNQGIIRKITGNFIDNYTQADSHVLNGGVIYNEGAISDIAGNFVDNHAQLNSWGSALGGAIYNRGIINHINGDFIANYVQGDMVQGGAIYNAENATIDDITGNFIANYVRISENGMHIQGGAIYNRGTIGNIIGNFVGNYVHVNERSMEAHGGAIYNWSSISNISGDFIGNYIQADERGTRSQGGAISNWGDIDSVSGNFIGNYIQVNDDAQGGALHNFYNGSIGNITGDFIGNFIQAKSGWVQGGAIYNGYNVTIGDITGNFIGNYAMNESGINIAAGGAIYTENNLSFTSGGKTHFMSGNYTKDTKRGKIYNALFVESGSISSSTTVTFDTSGGGAWVINDNIEGGRSVYDFVDYTNKYNLFFQGDDDIDSKTGKTKQYIAVNNGIINAGEVTVENTTLRFGAFDHGNEAKNSDGRGGFWASMNEDGTVNKEASAITSLSLKNAAFNIYNGYSDKVNLKSWSSDNGYLHIDVDTAALTADKLTISGDVIGTTNVLVYASGTEDISGKSIVFAEATGAGNEDSFKIWRVYNSPYLYDVRYAEADGNKEWSLVMNDEENPDAGYLPEIDQNPDVPDIDIPDLPSYVKVVPEVIAYGVLPTATIEQTRNMVSNINGEVANFSAVRRTWVSPTYYKSSSDALFDVDADIWGMEAGGDLQYDENSRLGLFFSYRNGKYDMNGQGYRYYSPTGSEIEIDSYLAGLYYRYGKNNWYGFATFYGGMQKADLKTNDGVMASVDGVEFGGSAEVGYTYALSESVSIIPSLGLYYSQINYGTAKDNAGKEAKYDNFGQLEFEAGVSLNKKISLEEGTAGVYVKPSIVQTMVDNDSVRISGLEKVDTLDDMTLGRIELGGRYGLNQNLSAFGWANYTFGSDYDASTFGLGLNYAF